MDEWHEMFNELVAAIDKGYVLANRIRNGEIKDTPDFAKSKDYMNGVMGAYMAMEGHVDKIYKKHGKKSKI